MKGVGCLKTANILNYVLMKVIEIVRLKFHRAIKTSFVNINFLKKFYYKKSLLKSFLNTHPGPNVIIPFMVANYKYSQAGVFVIGEPS